MKKVILLISLCIAVYANNYKYNFNKKDFTSIDSSFYTIDLVTLFYYDGYGKVVEELKNPNDLYVFEYGDDKSFLMTQILFGVFKTKKEALLKLQTLSPELKKHKAQIVQIGSFQELFNKHHPDIEVNSAYSQINDESLISFFREDTPLESETKLDYKSSIEFFNAIDYILDTYPKIQEQVYKLKSAKADRDEQFSVFLPTIDISYEQSRIKDAYDSTGATLETNNTSQDITFKWNLFNGFRDYNHYQMKNHKYNSTIFENKDFINTTVFEFITAYLELAKVRDKYILTVENLMQHKQYLNKMKAKQKYGMVSLTDSVNVFKKYVNAKLNNIEFLQKQYYDSLYKLQTYINIGKSTKVIATFKEIDFDVSQYSLGKLLNITVRSHPLIFKANSEIYLAQKELGKSYNNNMPKLDFVLKRSAVDIGYTDRNEINKETTIKLQAKMNLFNGRKDEYAIKKNLNTYKQSKFKYQSVIRELRYGVKTAFMAYRLLEDKKLFLEQNLENDQEAYKAALYDFEFAKVKEEAVVMAMEGLKDTKLKSIDFKYDLVLSKYKILLSMGILYDELLKRIEK